MNCVVIFADVKLKKNRFSRIKVDMLGLLNPFGAGNSPKRLREVGLCQVFLRNDEQYS